MDTTSNQLSAPCCSSSSSSPPIWDVFLSFYGKDTRRNFIANLYFALDQAGIRTFRDDPALEKGEEISSGLINAIEDSNMFVVVLSENYARSPWCLNELVQILISCKGRKNHAVIPVYYYVNPSDLRHQKGTFGEALESHKKRQSVDTIDKWRSALAEISEISGYHLKKDANENESDTIQEIVEKVAPQASTKVLHLGEYLLGIDFAIEEIYQKLSMESNDVRALGICGMGGIGKTTTAIAFFNKYSDKFDMSCFIENVKQYSQRGSPLLDLLEKLLVQLLRKKDYKVPNIESGKNKLEKILLSKKALIVLDDLDQSKSLARLCNLFSAGSRIIVTTRDTNLLNQLKVVISKVDIYMVKELGKNDSLELFSYHAFGRSMPPHSFKELSLMFVNYAGGLPLALKVLGSSLLGRTDVSFWKAHLEKVRVNPEIHEILKLSYDKLVYETEKEIFLDIVCFFVGKDKDEAFYVFKSCDFIPETGIPILVERCLLTIDGDNKFQMHNLIRDMGDKVIREETKHGKCRRLYKTWDALQNIEGTDKIEVLILDLTTWTKRDLGVIFERMPNLRLLQINSTHNIKDKGKFRNSFHNLRCIRWLNCPLTSLPFDFRPQHLVSIDMQYSKLKTLWKNNVPLTSLKHINVSYSQNLKRTPDFIYLKLVEKLLLRGCKNLLEVHPSIGQLSNLYHLDLGECYKVKDLNLGECYNLKYLNLRDCVNLKRLPAPIPAAPIMSNLGSLDLGGCRSLKRLPVQLGDMKGLKILDASCTAIEQVPDSIADLKELVELKLHMCKNLTSLPNSICKLELLKVLDLENCSKLERLPEPVEKMKSLEVVNVCGTSIKVISDSIGLLSRLRELNLGTLMNFESLLNSLRNLTSLSTLYLDEKITDTNNLADTVKNMKKLEKLVVRGNIRLWLPVILSFSSLKDLALRDEGGSFPSTKPFSLSTLSNLRDLKLANCKSLGSSFPELPLNLEQLWVYVDATLEQLPDLSILKQLNRLSLSKCISLQSLAALPPRLRVLAVDDCTSLQHVPDLSTLKELRSITFTGCSNLKSVSLKESSLQVLGLYSSFRAHLPNREIPEWFSYQSSGCVISFKIPPILGDNFLGVAIGLVYKCKKSITYGMYTRRYSNFTTVIKIKTEGITDTYEISVSIPPAEVQESLILYMRRDQISVDSGDMIEVSFQTPLYSDTNDVVGELKVKMCGAHVIQ